MPTSKEIEPKSHSPVPQGYVFGAREGEHLIHFRDGGDIFIKADPVKGSNNLGLGTQQLPKGSGIPVHRHLDRDEAFYVWKAVERSHSTMCVILAKEGGRFFIPKNTWHSFSSPDQELVLLWIGAPGRRRFPSRNCSRPGEPRKELTREQINAIGLKYGTEFR